MLAERGDSMIPPTYSKRGTELKKRGYFRVGYHDALAGGDVLNRNTPIYIVVVIGVSPTDLRLILYRYI